MPRNTRLKPYTTRMVKIEGPKEGKIYSNIYKEEKTQPWSMGSKIYPKVHENPRAFFSSSSPRLLESSIQYPWGVGLHHHVPTLHGLPSMQHQMSAVAVEETRHKRCLPLQMLERPSPMTPLRPSHKASKKDNLQECPPPPRL